MQYLSNKDQWINSDSYLFYGEELKDVLIKKGYHVVTAGNIMVFSVKGKPCLMFQLLQDLKLERLKNVGLIGYEKGSVIYFKGFDTFYMPTLRFRDCRMPTAKEFHVYELNRTI